MGLTRQETLRDARAGTTALKMFLIAGDNSGTGILENLIEPTAWD